MQEIINLRINKDESIVVYVPEFKKKINYFYKPTKMLHKFDEAIVIYKNKKQNMILLKEALQEILIRFSKSIKLALELSLRVPQIILDEKLGKLFSISCHDDKDFEYINCEVFLTNYRATWIYNGEDDKICFEISPLYEWMYKDSEEGDNYISFEQFIKNYQAEAEFCVNKKTLLEFKNECDQLIKKLDIWDGTDDDPNAKRIFVDAEHYG